MDTLHVILVVAASAIGILAQSAPGWAALDAVPAERECRACGQVGNAVCPVTTAVFLCPQCNAAVWEEVHAAVRRPGAARPRPLGVIGPFL